MLVRCIDVIGLLTAFAIEVGYDQDINPSRKQLGAGD